MLSIYKLHSIGWLVLIFLLYGINCDYDQNEDEWILLTRPHDPRRTTLSKIYAAGTVSTPVISMYDDSTNETLGKIFTADPYAYEQAELTKDTPIKYVQEMSTQQTAIQVGRKTDEGLQCLWCFTDGGYMSDESCYLGKT